MRRTSLIIIVCLLINQYFLISQEDATKIKNGKIGITYASFGENDVFRFDELVGAASYEGGYFYTFGINYVYPINKWLEAETGVEYSKQKIVIQPNMPPHMETFPTKRKLCINEFPCSIKSKFFKIFFCQWGLSCWY